MYVQGKCEVFKNVEREFNLNRSPWTNTRYFTSTAMTKQNKLARNTKRRELHKTNKIQLKSRYICISKRLNKIFNTMGQSWSNTHKMRLCCYGRRWCWWFERNASSSFWRRLVLSSKQRIKFVRPLEGGASHSVSPRYLVEISKINSADDR